ncbi:MAG: hypothetical protein H6956_06825 [Chromatiaceae bacterium]|nr:hypothetical protein [Gammaproteobacteria bacterium]MCP5317618.1 hypothetical protein [Chromatiaceae bacterium]MCP5430875.1 hypothetical protein [Chromatiaceae bacterium]MCW5586292.1 hypothetical protein [Chromatiales bacterium]HPQ24129.1 hypothetical protein [Gammaproteobacteria bacterium]
MSHSVVAIRRRIGNFLAWRTALPLLGGLLALVPLRSANGQDNVFFAEPISGRKVSNYCIDLPVGQNQRKTFAIPRDCPSVLQLIDDGSFYRSSVLDRRIWQKVESDCRYHGFLNRHPLEEMEDHVTTYDFMNARLDDLPIDRRCAHDEMPEGRAGCNPSATDAFGLLHHIPLGVPQGESATTHEGSACQLHDGVFRGRLHVDAGGIHCDAEPNLPSLRLIGVDFADVNGDRVLDAVLRFIPLGPGAVRLPMTLPVTRFNDSGPFTVPELDLDLERPSPPQLR